MFGVSVWDKSQLPSHPVLAQNLSNELGQNQFCIFLGESVVAAVLNRIDETFSCKSALNNHLLSFHKTHSVIYYIFCWNSKQTNMHTDNNNITQPLHLSSRC